MKRYLIVYCFLLVRSVYAFDLFHPTDTVTQVLQSLKPDTAKVLALAGLSYKYLTSEPSKAKQLAEEAVVLARKLKFGRGEMMALNNLSEYHFRQSNYAKSIEYSTLILKLAGKRGDSLALADAYRLLGNTNTFGLKQYDQALIYHLKALKIFKLRNEQLKIAAEYGSITWIYAITNQNIEKAHREADEGVAIAKALKNDQILSYNYNSKGLLFFKQNQFDSALANLQKSNEAGARANDLAVISYNKSIIGNIYLRQHKYDAAIKVFDQSVIEGERLNLREVLKDAYEGLSKGYEGKRQFDKAFKFNVMYHALKDSLLNWETTQKTLMIQRGYEEERKGSIIVQLEKENELVEKEKNIYVILFASGFAILVTIIIVIFRTNRQRRMTNRLLQDKNDEIKTQNEELLQSREEISAQRDVVAEQNKRLQEVNDTKDKLFSIIGHDLRGPIATLRSLLGLVERDVVSADELKTLTPKINQNVGKLHEMLENLLQWSRAQMTGFISKPVTNNVHLVADNILNFFNETAAEKRIQLTNDAPGHLEVFADENHLKLILRNLISNSIKFTPEGGSVTVLAKRMNEFVEIVIKDSGVGISSDGITKLFERNAHFTSHGTQGEKGTGLGLVLCREMAEANGGRISVSSVIGSGSSFSVFLKAHE